MEGGAMFLMTSGPQQEEEVAFSGGPLITR